MVAVLWLLLLGAGPGMGSTSLPETSSVAPSGSPTDGSPGEGSGVAAPDPSGGSDLSGAAAGADIEFNKTAKIEELLKEASELRFARRVDDDEEEFAGKILAKIIEAEGLGSAEATALRGELYLLGEGVPPNLTLAMRHLQAAADRGNPRAQLQLAFIYDWGLHRKSPGIAGKDEPLALLHYYFAAVGGQAEAQMVLGYRHLYGAGVPKSCNAAIKYYSKVAQQVVVHHAEKSIAKPIELVRLSDDKARANKLEETEDVIQYYQHSADNGNAEAQVALGQLNFYGARGVAQNTERAADYFRRAAEQGNAAAKSNLAQMHIQGLGVKESNETAFKYFQEAAAQGDAAAQNGLGFMYLHGYGTKQDHQKAIKYFKMSSEQGNVDAQFNLGAMYFSGMGIDVDYGAALQYFTLAGHQGHIRSLFNLAQMHINGLGTVQSCPIAVKLFKSVSERGPWARALSTAHRDYLRGDYHTAFVKYSRAADQGYELAQSNAAWMLEREIGYESTDKNDVALLHLQRAAVQGNVDAHRVIGDHYYYGLTKAPNFEEAAKHYTLAGEQKNAHANFNLGFMHQHGIGLPFDLHLAKRFYDLALESSPEAYIPVQLALFGLQVHTLYLQLKDYYEPWQDGTKASKKQKATPKSEQENKDGAAAGSGTTPSSGSSQPGDAGRVSWEDVLLLVACGLFAVLIFFRSQGVRNR